MKEKFRLEESVWAAEDFTVSINSGISYITFYYTFTASVSQNPDLLSGSDKAVFDGVGRVWTAMHRGGIITKEVCVKQTKLYTILCCQSTWDRTFTW